MSETQETDGGKLSLSKPKKLELKKTVDGGQVRQSFSHGRSKTVAVEIKKKRSIGRDAAAPERTTAKTVRAKTPAPTVAPAPEESVEIVAAARGAYHPDTTTRGAGIVLRELTDDEKEARARALEGAKKADSEARHRAEIEATRRAEEQTKLEAERDAAAQRAELEEERKRAEEEARLRAEEQAAKRLTEQEEGSAPDAEERTDPRRPGRGVRRFMPVRRDGQRRRSGKLTVSQALDENERVRSLASVRRAREKERRAAEGDASALTKIIRDVVVPETITVEELANRMAERGNDVIKALMGMGVMATINQSIDADIAEVVTTEFGHRVKRVSAADVEIGLKGEDDTEDSLVARPPVVTVMGHVDHGKTSLLDALRETDVAAGEAGGITQHIGAYQIETETGGRITFIDTPGHEAFTAMRAHGARLTDLVVLVVAADDGIMPQTVEAIDHAKAAEVPIIVAINKIDKPAANPDRVRQELLQHELVVESLGGDVLCVELSATAKTNLDKLEETILLQSEVLELDANPNRAAEGIVIEAQLDRGRGTVATVLVQRGTLNVGDILVAGSEWGRVRALLDDRGRRLDAALPAQPVEVLGLGGVPGAGDEFVVAENETRARQVTSFREDQSRQARAAAGGRSTLEQMFTEISQSEEARELPVVVKTDVRGSLEAILNGIENLNSDEVQIRVLHAAVGGVNESDVVLANASNALVLGFNIRADSVARDLARQIGTEIRYYTVIYELIDELKAILSGMLAPEVQEHAVGTAEVLEVFNISKLGRIAGCRISEGTARRNVRARLVRDNIVVHEGAVGSLKRFRDDAREVNAGNECGVGFENYQDIQPGDTIEFFEVEHIARSL